jgi:hypothetical protein
MEAGWLVAYSTLCYLCVHSSVHYLNMSFNNLYYRMHSQQRVEYRQYQVSFLHSVTATWMSYRAMSHPHAFKTLEPSSVNTLAIVHTCGYFSVDFYLTAFVRQSLASSDIQMHVHHLLSISSLLICLNLDNWTTVIATCLLFIESSTIFICIRWLLY